MTGVPEGNVTLSIPKVHVRRGGPERHRMMPRVAQQARLGGIVIYSGYWRHLFFSCICAGDGQEVGCYLWPCLTTCGLV